MEACELEYRQVGGTDNNDEVQDMDDLIIVDEVQDMDDLAQTEWVNMFFSVALTQEVVGPSHLGGAPSATQDYTQGEQTPVPK